MQQTNQVETLSVFMPAYNESHVIGQTLGDVTTFLKTLTLNKYEVIVVNDGSKDTTAEIVRDFEKKDPHVRLVNLEKNQGYGVAVKTGYYEAKYDYIFFMDSDGQFDIADISQFIQKIKEADLVVGYRMNRQDHLMRIINGWGWTQISNVLFGLGVKDVDCAFKMIRREVLETIPHLQSTRGAMINPELLARAKKAGFKIDQIGVKHLPRKGGKSTGANIEVIISSFVDLLKFWWRLTFIEPKKAVA